MLYHLAASLSRCDVCFSFCLLTVSECRDINAGGIKRHHIDTSTLTCSCNIVQRKGRTAKTGITEVQSIHVAPFLSVECENMYRLLSAFRIFILSSRCFLLQKLTFIYTKLPKTINPHTKKVIKSFYFGV